MAISEKSVEQTYRGYRLVKFRYAVILDEPDDWRSGIRPVREYREWWAVFDGNQERQPNASERFKNRFLAEKFVDQVLKSAKQND